MAEAGAEYGNGDTKNGWYVLAYGDEYFASRHSRVEFVSFEYRVSSLAWLRSKITKSVDVELAELHANRETGPIESVAGRVRATSCSTSR